MKSIYLSLFLLLLTYQTSSAQSVQFDWGKVNKTEESYLDNERFLHYDSSGYIFVTLKEYASYPAYEKVLFEKYDLSHQLIFSKVVLMKTPVKSKRKNHADYVDAVQIGDSTIILMEDSYPFNNTKFLYAMTFGPDGQQGQTIAIDTLSVSGHFGIKRIKSQKGFLAYAKNYEYSADYDAVFIGGKPNSMIHLKMFDTELKAEWSFHKILPYTTLFYRLTDFVITEDGSAYVAGYKDPLSPFKDEDTLTRENSHQLYVYQSTTGQLVTMNLSLGNADYINDLKLSYLDGLLYVAGYYGDATKKDDYDEKRSRDGIALQVINIKNMQTIQNTKSPFNAAQLLNIIGEKKMKKGEKLPDTYTLDHIIPSQNKGIIIIGEYHFHNKMHSTIATRNNILVTMIDTAGHISWTHTIWKRRQLNLVYETSRSTAYLVHAKNNILYLLHEDAVKNQYVSASSENINAFDYNDDRYIALTTFTSEGVWHKKKYVTEMKDPYDQTQADLFHFYKIDDEHFFVGSHNRKKSIHKFGIITFR